MIGPEKWVSSFSFREHDVLRRWLALSCVWKEREKEFARVVGSKEQRWPIVASAVKEIFLRFNTDNRFSVELEDDHGSCWPQMRHDTCFYG